jgi:hypothetical protein
VFEKGESLSDRKSKNDTREDTEVFTCGGRWERGSGKKRKGRERESAGERENEKEKGAIEYVECHSLLTFLRDEFPLLPYWLYRLDSRLEANVYLLGQQTNHRAISWSSNISSLNTSLNTWTKINELNELGEMRVDYR